MLQLLTNFPELAVSFLDFSRFTRFTPWPVSFHFSMQTKKWNSILKSIPSEDGWIKSNVTTQKCHQTDIRDTFRKACWLYVMGIVSSKNVGFCLMFAVAENTGCASINQTKCPFTVIFFCHMTSLFYWKIIATVLWCFIAGECDRSVNIMVWWYQFRSPSTSSSG